jgi:hypothetical protein
MTATLGGWKKFYLHFKAFKEIPKNEDSFKRSRVVFHEALEMRVRNAFLSHCSTFDKLQAIAWITNY